MPRINAHLCFHNKFTLIVSPLTLAALAFDSRHVPFNMDEMRAAFKYWKRKKPPPDYTQSIDLHSKIDPNDVTRTELRPNPYLDDALTKYGAKPSHDWEAFTFARNDGLVYIKNPFTPCGQRYWIARCLKDYTKKPHKLNIDAHGYLKSDEDWWTESERNKNLMKSLRWATLGYHHDWDAKVYTEVNRDDFPDDLREFCKATASLLGYDDYSGQASIVNFYHMDSTLSPHTDSSEKNLEAPLISISFGQSAIFLIGNEKGDVTAMHLHSGDIVIMSKKSRLSHHAVPKIIESVDRPWNSGEIDDPDVWKHFDEYIGSNRININVRQVLFNDQNRLDQIS